MTCAMSVVELMAAGIALAGMAQSAISYRLVRSFSRRLGPARAIVPTPPMTILKPLCGDEPLLFEALSSLCEIDYPTFQIVFGVQDPADPAIGVVRALRVAYPRCDIALVVDPTVLGANRKIANLQNMVRLAKHDHLVIGDSDVHVAPDYLRAIAAEFARPGTGMVTTLYAGLPANDGMVAALGATSLTHTFLPGALMARALGRQDVLGVTMALRRETLAAIGGLAAIADELADDHALGSLVESRGLAVRLAATVTATTVPEARLGPLFRHELRWARTVLSIVPVAFSLSALQYPTAWAGLAALVSGGHEPALALFVAAWMTRAAAARGIDRALGLRTAAPILLMPVRDILSMTVLLASYGSKQVEWRGQTMQVGRLPAPDFTPNYAADYGATDDPAPSAG